ncbi:type III restriction enzyme [Xylariomycetidae sp. FL0641]|nr:type III restriction enzyme [Xylariomycetidae sp. FL0641]
MDSDDFDDDVADEDLIFAATQGSSSNRKRNASANFIDLEDLPSDAFESSPAVAPRSSTGLRPAARGAGSVTSFRQTTLFGQAVDISPSQRPGPPSSNRVFRADLPPEEPTHHALDQEALKTWVYPTNLGPTRDYQFSIVKNGLFNNTLVALPTGLGKTFIAATVMLNFHRWLKQAKIVFVAPTKPLASQQVDACFHVAGIPRSETTLLTGEIPPALRAEEWESKRVFFMTPQTLEHDLSSGFADPKSIGLLVVDEAHRATGNYSYVKVIEFLRRFSKSFRVLALTATPGSKVEAVQEVIDSLGISHVEIRTEESIDIRQYVHQRDEDIILLDPTEEMELVKDLFSKALKPLVDKLGQQNIYYGRDPMSLTTYGLIKAKQDWIKRAGHGSNSGLKYMMAAIFAVLSSLAHSIKLLNFHGIRPFYHNLEQFRDETEGKGNKASKYKLQILEHPSFKEMMNKVSSWCRKDDFVSHPKLTCLCDTVLNHFMDAGEGREGGGSSNTRIIVFSEYRDSAEEIVRVLNTHKPLIRAAVFVGQADSKRSEGMKQAEQIARINKFKSGELNVLVATSIGEEGLDIGQVDLIICFDASASPIRMLQRMGRTGRKRAGRVVLLLMRGKEENNYAQSKDGYEKMQLMICDGSRFNFRHDLSTRIVPREVRPEVVIRAVEIPIENTQVSGLPEPKKSRARKKKPPKKFHMPDGVETGFQSVASLLGKPSKSKQSKPQTPVEEDEIADVPELGQVLLHDTQHEELDSVYRYSYGHQGHLEEIEEVDVTAHPLSQRSRRKTVNLKHGRYTKRSSPAERFTKPYGDYDKSRYNELPLPAEGSDTEDEVAETEPARKKIKTAAPPHEVDSDEDDELVELPKANARAQTTKSAPGRKKQIANRAAISTPHNLEPDDALPRPRKQATAPKTKKAPSKAAAPKRPRGRPRKNQAALAPYDESADEGDDCRRTSDLELTDDSDEGEDLVDFVVGDDVATSSNHVLTSSFPLPTSSPVHRRRRHRPKSTSPTSPSTPSTLGGAPSSLPRAKPYYEFAGTQDSIDDDDEVPSMTQIARNQGPTQGSKPSSGRFEVDDDEEDGEEDSPVQQRSRARPNKRRRAVLDEDEDEDSDD